MGKFSKIILGTAIALSVAAFVLALWPVDALRESQETIEVVEPVVEPEVSESTTQWFDKLLAKCHTRLKYMSWTVVNDPVHDRIFHEFMNLGCLDLVELEMPFEVLQEFCKDYFGPPGNQRRKSRECRAVGVEDGT